MPYMNAMIIGLKCEVCYSYEPPENGDGECVTIEAIEISDSHGDICIDPNELHKSQLDALEKEAMRHHKERGV